MGHHFVQHDLLVQALTHSSHAREVEAAQTIADHSAHDNEQLEFLGDAVLALITSEELFRRFPAFREGQLSKLRAHLVSEKHLFHVAQQLCIGDYLHLGRGEEKSGGRHKTALLADALEAVLGAIYLDGGLVPVRDLVLHHVIGPELERMARNGSSLPTTDYKSMLQEKLQASGRSQPSYVLIKEHGPEHSKTFTIEARLLARQQGGGVEFAGRAEGLTKKSAEQDAAHQVLDYLATLPENTNGKGHV